jgi:hypothetical protein
MFRTGWSWRELDETPQPVLDYYRALGRKQAEIANVQPNTRTPQGTH